MRIDREVPLAPKTTLGLGGAAKRFVRVESVYELREALTLAGADPILILGGGSNLVVRDEGFAGLVIEIGIGGMRISMSPDHALVAVGAGVVWDDFVAQMVDAKFAGVECLSGIPGLVGATPMQNVGAYGQEVADTILSVNVLDRESGELVELDTAACGFGYRTSMFRGSARWIVCEVVFQLARGTESAPIKYAELAKALGVGDGGRVPLSTARDTVIRLRRGKGMVVDPHDPESRSAGSFFTNPIVDAATLAAFEARVGGEYPSWKQPDGATKLAAGWLIERAGFAKGYTRGHVGISHKHALALVNRGNGTATELLALATEIQDRVRERLGIELQPEPIIV